MPEPSDSPRLDYDRQTLPWLDRVLAEIVDYCRAAKTDPGEQYQLRERLLHWVHYGFVVLERAIPHELIDAFLADVHQLFEQRQRYRVVVAPAYETYVPACEFAGSPYGKKGLRILDLHNSSVAAKRLSLHASVVEFLGHVFRERVVAMQSLTFLEGTQQTIHQDYAYVVTRIPSHLAASWIALEDIHVDAGPLYYYSGSHTIPKFQWGDGLFRTAESSRNEDQFAQYIHESCQAARMPLTGFAGKKGDVFVWHSALAHGGAIAKNPSLTRKSYVTHYSTQRGMPHDYRAPGVPPTEIEINGGLVYRHPHRPEDEDQLRNGADLP